MGAPPPDPPPAFPPVVPATGTAWLEAVTSARILAGAFMGGMILLSALIYWNDYRVEMRKAEDLTRALTQAAEAQINGSLRTIDLLLQHVARYLAARNLSEETAIYDSLNLQARAFPEVKSLFIVDADGLRAGRFGRDDEQDVSGRNYFIYQKYLFAMNRVVIDGPELHPDEPARPPEIVLARAMVGEDGAFKGVVAAALAPDFFNDPLKAAGLDGRGVALVANSNGIVLSRFPGAEEWIGRSIADGRLVRDLLPHGAGGVYRTGGDLDGTDQISAWRALAHYPLVVATGIPIDLVRSKWWAATRYKLLVEVAFAALLVYLAYQLDRRERHGRRIARDLARLNEELEQRVAERTRTLRDEIAERVKAQEEKNELAQIIQVATRLPIIVYRLDERAVFTEAIGEGLHRIGLSDREAVGLFAGDLLPECIDPFRAALAGGSAAFESASQVDGRTVAFAHFVTFDKASQRGAVGIAVDVTGRVTAETALTRVKEAYQDLIEGAIEGILIHRDFKPLLANESCARMFGFHSVDEVLALPTVLAMVAADDRDRVAATVRRRMGGDPGVPPVYEFQGVRRDGSPIWCLNSARRIEWEGQPAIQAAFMDMSHAKHIEQGLTEAKEAAEQASIAKTRFLAAASHDLRQPVQALNLYINVLAHRPHPPDTAEIIERIRDSASALGDLLNSLLDISKLEAGLVRPERQGFVLSALLDRLWAEFVPVGEAAGVSVSVVVTGACVESDPTLLERILQNLIGNAIRYTPAGGKVLVGGRRRGTNLVLQVWDTGRGIPQGHLQTIFEEFFQVGNTERDRRQGLGLGLAIVRRLAGLLDHPLSVRSRVGRGSLFEVRVPLAETGEGGAAVRRVALDVSDQAGRMVVVIDDEFDVRNSLMWQLRDWGYDVLAAGSSAEALDLMEARTRVPDLVLVDFRLRDGETGLTAAARLADHAGRRLPVILLTGDTAPDRLRDAEQSGYRMLHKPIRSDDLRQAVVLEIKAGLAAPVS